MSGSGFDVYTLGYTSRVHRPTCCIALHISWVRLPHHRPSQTKSAFGEAGVAEALANSNLGWPLTWFFASAHDPLMRWTILTSGRASCGQVFSGDWFAKSK